MGQERRKSGRDTRVDIYARITDCIVAALEKGVRPWIQPWNAGHVQGRITRPLRHNGEPYTGINVLLLWSEAVSRGFSSPIWMTFRQATELGGHVRKGETGSIVVYANRLRKMETAENGDEIERDIPYLKAYTVFNIEQINNLPDEFRPSPVEDAGANLERIAAVDAFFSATGALIRHGGTKAFYAPDSDAIQMPPIERFRDVASYYATLAHESVHNADIQIMPINPWMSQTPWPPARGSRHNTKQKGKLSAIVHPVVGAHQKLGRYEPRGCFKTAACRNASQLCLSSHRFQATVFAWASQTQSVASKPKTKRTIRIRSTFLQNPGSGRLPIAVPRTSITKSTTLTMLVIAHALVALQQDILLASITCGMSQQ